MAVSEDEPLGIRGHDCKHCVTILFFRNSVRVGFAIYMGFIAFDGDLQVIATSWVVRKRDQHCSVFTLGARA